MSVRVKTAATICLTLLGLLIILYVAYSNIIANNVASLEVAGMTSDVDRVQAALNQDIARLNTTVGDWASWDDTYQFALDGNVAYVESNLAPATLSNLQLNLIAFVANSGQVVYGTDFDLITAREQPLATSLADHVRAGSPFLELKQPSDKLTGILMLEDGPILIAAQPILTSEQTGPSQGALLMGRWLDSAVIDELARRTHLMIDIFPSAAGELPDDVVSARDALSTSSLSVAAISEDIVAGYTQLNDIYGQPTLIVRVEAPRIVYAQSILSRNYFILTLLISGLAFGLVTILSIERIALSRLARLNYNVQRIGRAGDPGARVEVSGQDEISALSASVNSMLGSLELSHSREREGQERYRAVIEQTSEGIFLCDADTKRILEANPAFLALLGYTPEELLALTLYDVIEDDPAQIDQRLQTILSHGPGLIGERPYRRKTGSTVWVEVSTNVIQLSHRLVICAVIRDITERKQAADALRESERRYRALFESNPHPMWIYDLDSLVFLAVNDSAVGQYGYTRDEFRAMRIDDIRPADDLPARRENLARGREAVEVSCWRHRKKNGAVIEVEITSHAIRWGSHNARMILAHDITERRRAEEIQLANERRFRALVENSADAITLFNAEGTVVYDSPAAPGLLGYAHEELVGQNALDYVHPADVAAVRHLLSQALQHPTTPVEAVFRFRHKNGNWRWLEAVGRNLLDEPSVQAIIVNYRDITERKQSQAQFAENAAELAALYRATAPLLHPASDLALTAEEIARAVTQEFALADCGVLVVDKARTELIRIARCGDYMVTSSAPLPLDGRGITVAAWQTGEIVYVPDVRLDERYVPNETRTRSELAVPLQVSREVIGILDLQSPEPDAFDERARRIVAAYAERAALALQAAHLHGQTQQQMQHLLALRSIDIAITASLDLHLTLNILLEHARSQLQVDAADVLIIQAPNMTLSYAAGSGFRSTLIQQAKVRLGEGYSGRAALDRRIIALPDLGLVENGGFIPSNLVTVEGFQAYYAVPLLAKGRVRGVLEIYHRQSLKSSSEWLEFLDALSGQAAIAIDNAELFAQLEQSNARLRLAYDATIEGWSRALDLRDKETEGHTQRVTELTLKLARSMGLTEEALVHIRRGALLHDIGKMGVPDHILLKPDPLTDSEWEIMARHPRYAYEMLAPIAYLQPALDIPVYHHEKWDGTGYPEGLKGEQIPLAARIFAVVDVWDALRSDRPYRPAWPPEKVREHIAALAGKHFDPAVLRVFLQTIAQGQGA